MQEHYTVGVFFITKRSERSLKETMCKAIKDRLFKNCIFIKNSNDVNSIKFKHISIFCMVTID